MNQKDELYFKRVFVTNLRHYLQEKGVTQKELAEGLNVSQGAICDWMALRRYPRMDGMQRIAEYFGIEISDLVEPHDMNGKHYTNKELKRFETIMKNSPELIELFLSIERLSDEKKALVKAMVDAMHSQGGQ